MPRTPEEIAALFNEALLDVNFMAWLSKYNPDWQSAHSGEIVGLFDAWCDGYREGRGS